MAQSTRWAVYTLYFVVFVDIFQLTFVFPFIPLIVAGFGGSAATVAERVAHLSSLAALGQMLSSPILGWVSDRIGRRRVFLIATLGSAASSVLLAFSPSYEVSVAARMFNGLAGGTAAIANTYLSDITTTEERPVYMSKMTAMTGIGLTVGPLVGAFLYNTWGIPAACFCAALVSLANFLFIVLFLDESKKKVAVAQTEAIDAAEDAKSKAWPCSLYFVFLSSFFLQPISVVFTTFSNLYVSAEFYGGDEHQGTILFSNCIVVIGLALLFVPLLLYAHFLKCVGFNCSIVVGIITMVAGLIGNGMAPVPWMFLVSTAVWAFGNQLMGPVTPILIGRLAPADSLGSAFGWLQGVGNASRVIGPTVISPLYNWYPSSIFYLLAGCMVVVGVISFVVSTTNPDSSQDKEAEAGHAEPLLHTPCSNSSRARAMTSELSLKSARRVSC